MLAKSVISVRDQLPGVRPIGTVTPYEFAIALAENAVDNGVEVRLNREVKAIETLPEGGFSIRTRCGKPSNAALCGRASSAVSLFSVLSALGLCSAGGKACCPAALSPAVWHPLTCVLPCIAIVVWCLAAWHVVHCTSRIPLYSVLVCV